MSEALTPAAPGGDTDEGSKVRPTAPRSRSWWVGHLGDLIAAAVVLLGGGLLGSALFQGPELFGPTGVPPAHGPSPIEPGATEQADRPLGAHLATLALLIVPAALMFLRRRWPIPVFGVAFAGFILAVLFGLPSLGPGIATTIAAYAYAFRVPRRQVLIVIAGATGLVIVLAFAMTGWESLDTRVFQVGAALAIAAALGDSARSRQEYLVQVEDRARRAEQTREAEARRRVSEERLRIARDLHDTVAHQISVINLHAGAASGYLADQPERAQGALGTIREAARGALGEIGDLLRYLRDDESADSAPPQQSLEALDALLDRMRDAGLTIETDIRGDLSRAVGSVGAVAYRVIQEGLTNAHKHGGRAARLRIAVGADHLGIGIENAVAEDVARAQSGVAGTGLGLIGLRERVTAAKGTVSTSRQGELHRLDVELPLPQREGEST